MKEVFIVKPTRTPIGSFGGALANLSAVALGTSAIGGVLEESGVSGDLIDEVYMGNVLSANLGQAPARQAALGAGIHEQTPCTLINKVCASGMKSAMIGAQSIMLGFNDLVIAGGMESMSNVPYHVSKARFGYKYGHGELVDGLLKDGLTEVYHQFPMGNCADKTASEMGISRSEQDEFAISSYEKAQQASKEGRFESEITPVEIPQRKGDPVIFREDEECFNVKFDKIPSLRPVFSKEGTVTAANASTINDGASAMLLASKEKVAALGLKPIAKIIGMADAAQAPIWFTTSPALAIPKAIKQAGLQKSDIDYYEINEAFSVVALANARLLELEEQKVNVNGGAVALGHPLGVSGARIMTTLAHALSQRDARYGVAAICNGGGGASAVVLERV